MRRQHLLLWILLALIIQFIHAAPVDVTSTTSGPTTPTVSPPAIESLTGASDSTPAPPFPTGMKGEELIKDELSSHFGIEEKSLENIENLLLKLKEKTHKKVFGDRIFSRDVSVFGYLLNPIK